MKTTTDSEHPLATGPAYDPLSLKNEDGPDYAGSPIDPEDFDPADPSPLY
jgi:hypothetical protein